MTLEQGLQRLAKLDVQQRKWSQEATAIYSVSATGQHPPCFDRAIDKAIEVGKKKAQIWNMIRHKIITNFKTLWQAVLEYGLVVRTCGEEECLSIYVPDIKKAIEYVKTNKGG